MSKHILVAAILSVLLASACGGDDESPSGVQLVTASAGGTVQAGSSSVEIPPMALTADTEVSLEAANASSYPALEGARPSVLRLEPEGTVLARPATVTIGASLVGAGAGDEVSVRQLASGDGIMQWVPVESSRDAETGNVLVPITRFAPLAVVVARTGTPPAGLAIRGTLRWGDGSPVDAAPVQLLQSDRVLTTTTTDPAGYFFFGDLSAGTYVVSIDYECMLSETVEVTSETAALDLVLCGGS